MVVGCVRALRGMGSAVGARSEEACGYRGQTGVLVASEKTIRLRQATEGAPQRSTDTRYACFVCGTGP